VICDKFMSALVILKVEAKLMEKVNPILRLLNPSQDIQTEQWWAGKWNQMSCYQVIGYLPRHHLFTCAFLDGYDGGLEKAAEDIKLFFWKFNVVIEWENECAPFLGPGNDNHRAMFWLSDCWIHLSSIRPCIFLGCKHNRGSDEDLSPLNPYHVTHHLWQHCWEAMSVCGLLLWRLAAWFRKARLHGLNFAMSALKSILAENANEIVDTECHEWGS
jgi:hypothetical protein